MEHQRQNKIVLGCIFLVTLSMAVMSCSKKGAEEENQAQLSSIFKADEKWEIVTPFIHVAGTQALYFAEAHRLGEKEDIRRRIFLETSSCFGGIPGIRIPSVGEKVPVVMIDIKSQSNLVDESPTIMNFVKRPCQ